jgi:hypothetical protein
MLSLAMAAVGLASSAQNSTIPFRQIEREAQLSSKRMAPASAALISDAHEMPSWPSPSDGYVFVPPATVSPRTASNEFFLINGLHLGMSVFDVGMTQHCIADNHCREGNPLMPSSLVGQLSVNFAYVGYGTFVSYRLKKRGSKLWVLSPIVGIATHSVGVASGFANY